MFLHFRAQPASTGRLRSAQAAGLLAFAFFLTACAPRAAPVISPDPVDRAAATLKMRARPMVEPYVSRRPVEPSTPWRDAQRTKAGSSGPGR